MKRSFLQAVASFFALYGIIFIPFPFYLIKVQLAVTEFLFGKLIAFVSTNLFGRALPDTRVFSDSSPMYLLVFILAVLSTVTALLLASWRKWPEYRTRVLAIIYTICIYYLALQLLKYGFDKVFKNQFYLPEPNILYTPVGHLDKDLLYWTSMGTSHFYSVFMGVLEVFAAGFLLFRKLRVIGLLMSLAIMTNVVAVNLGFDIGVKLFSIFLLFLTIFLLIPFARNLYRVLTQQSVTILPASESKRGPFLRYFLKCFVIGLMLLEVLYPFVRTMNFNGDLAKRPYLHGAYQVEEMTSGFSTLTPGTFPVKRLFIHSDGYMIFQDEEENMKDYKFRYNSGDSVHFLTDYQAQKIPVFIQYNGKDSQLILKFINRGDSVSLKAKAIDWRSLPALKKGFHWITD